MTAPAGPPALLCTDSILERYGDRLTAAAPDLQPVGLVRGRTLDETELARLRVAFFSGDAYPERAADFMGTVLRAPALEWLHTFSVGTDHPVFTGLLARGVRVSASSGSSAAGGPPARPRPPRAPRPGRGPPGAGVGGMGPIGLEVIRMATALGMRPIGMRRAVVGDEPCATWPLDRLPELAAVVDALVVALPLTDDTRGIISAEVISRMRPDAVFVNVGRGDLVDEGALADALTAGRLGGAGLDVFVTEPLPPESELWDLPNTIITPHMSGTCSNSDDRATELFLANLAAFARGEPLANER